MMILSPRTGERFHKILLIGDRQDMSFRIISLVDEKGNIRAISYARVAGTGQNFEQSFANASECDDSMMHIAERFLDLGAEPEIHDLTQIDTLDEQLEAMHEHDELCRIARDVEDSRRWKLPGGIQ